MDILHFPVVYINRSRIDYWLFVGGGARLKNPNLGIWVRWAGRGEHPPSKSCGWCRPCAQLTKYVFRRLILQPQQCDMIIEWGTHSSLIGNKRKAHFQNNWKNIPKLLSVPLSLLLTVLPSLNFIYSALLLDVNYSKEPIKGIVI